MDSISLKMDKNFTTKFRQKLELKKVSLLTFWQVRQNNGSGNVTLCSFFLLFVHYFYVNFLSRDTNKPDEGTLDQKQCRLLWVVTSTDPWSRI